MCRQPKRPRAGFGGARGWEDAEIDHLVLPVLNKGALMPRRLPSIMLGEKTEAEIVAEA